MYSPRSKDHLSRVVFSARVLQFFVLIRWLHPCFIICILNYKKDIFFIAEGRNDNQSESNNPDIVRAAHAMQCCASSLPYLTTDNIVDSWLKTFGNQFPFFNGCFFLVLRTILLQTFVGRQLYAVLSEADRFFNS